MPNCHYLQTQLSFYGLARLSEEKVWEILPDLGSGGQQVSLPEAAQLLQVHRGRRAIKSLEQKEPSRASPSPSCLTLKGILGNHQGPHNLLLGLGTFIFLSNACPSSSSMFSLCLTPQKIVILPSSIVDAMQWCLCSPKIQLLKS